MAEMRFRMSWQLVIAIVLVLIVACVPVIIYFLDYKGIFIYITSAIIGWTVLVLIALMGAFFLGLAVGHRVAAKSDFTPFEKEMLVMKEEVKHLKDLLHRHNVHHKGKKEVPVRARERPSQEETPLVEEEPEPPKPEDPGPEMKPLGKVRCGKCKEVIPLYSKDRPLEIRCTSCGKKGVLK